MIEIKGVTKSFGEKLVLDDLSTTFSRGKINLIIGRSGSGKTVAIKSMLGLHNIDSGDIFFNERNFSIMNCSAPK